MNLDFWISVAVLAGIYGVFTLGLQLNAGLTGILNFGQAGFMAIGAYAYGLLVVNAQWNPWAAVAAAVLAAVAAALLVGLSSLRLRTDYFAIATIAFAEMVRYTLQNAQFSGGNQGVLGYDTAWRGFADAVSSRLSQADFGGHSQLPLLVLVWAVFVVLIIVLTLLERTPWGRILKALREDEDAVSALGKNALSYKLQSLAISAAIAAVAGVFVALNITYLYPSVFDPNFTFFGYAMLVIGGLGSFAGTALGGLLFWALLEGTRFVDLALSAGQQASLRFILVGVALIVLNRVRPQGLLGDRAGMVAGR
ncbi:MAG TPA: branched-chain amino acid ABC transporter permease [Lichenihabitans sp.]|nr:branched-chain amino acid ABC transporter permease [Lichenihabitans sp.]